MVHPVPWLGRKGSTHALSNQDRVVFFGLWPEFDPPHRAPLPSPIEILMGVNKLVGTWRKEWERKEGEKKKNSSLVCFEKKKRRNKKIKYLLFSMVNFFYIFPTLFSLTNISPLPLLSQISKQPVSFDKRILFDVSK